jgi:hypothetical protein
MLHAYIVPGKNEGGETEFANMVAAYDALDDEMKKKCDNLVVIHDFYWSRRDVRKLHSLRLNAMPFRRCAIPSFGSTRNPAARRFTSAHTRAKLKAWTSTKAVNLSIS